MRVACIHCRSEIPGQEINTAKDVARCPSCNEVYALSELVAAEDLTDSDATPSGARFEKTPDGFRIEAWTRSPMAIVFVPGALVWAAAHCAALASSSTLSHSDIAPAVVFGVISLGFELLFIWASLLAIAGRVVVTVERGEGSNLTGVGRWGWKRRFDWNGVRRIGSGSKVLGQPWAQGNRILLIGKKTFALAGIMTHERREWMKATLRRVRVERPRARIQRPGAVSIAEADGELSLTASAKDPR